MQLSYTLHDGDNEMMSLQIRQQSSHFLRGFQQLMQKDWIDMFNEHELQVLWSTSKFAGCTRFAGNSFLILL